MKKKNLNKIKTLWEAEGGDWEHGGVGGMFVTYDAESYFKNFLWIGKEEAAIQIYDTIPVPEMIKEEDVD